MKKSTKRNRPNRPIGKRAGKPRFFCAGEGWLLTNMPYLHGDIEIADARDYEYARESAVLREAAAMYKAEKRTFERERSRQAERPKKMGGTPLGTGGRPGGVEVYRAVEEKFHCGTWFMQSPWKMIWGCPSFPEKAWHELSASELKEIGLAIRKEVRPLEAPGILLLDAMEVLNFWKKQASNMRTEIKKKGHSHLSRDIAIAVSWPDESLAHLVITLPLDQSAKEITRRFNQTLKRPEIKELIQSSRERVGEAKDRLKDLAAWRLYRELGYLKSLDFADANRLSDSAGEPRAFHDPRHGQGTESRALSESPLFSDVSGFGNAKQRAKQWLAEKMPSEVSAADLADASNGPRRRLSREMLKKLELHDVLPEQHTQIVHHQGEWRVFEPVGGDKLKIFPKGSKGPWTGKENF